MARRASIDGLGNSELRAILSSASLASRPLPPVAMQRAACLRLYRASLLCVLRWLAGCHCLRRRHCPGGGCSDTGLGFALRLPQRVRAAGDSGSRLARPRDAAPRGHRLFPAAQRLCAAARRPARRRRRRAEAPRRGAAAPRLEAQRGRRRGALRRRQVGAADSLPPHAHSA